MKSTLVYFAGLGFHGVRSASLYIQGHCDASVNGVWSEEVDVVNGATNRSFHRSGTQLVLYEADDGWLMQRGSLTLARSMDPWEAQVPSRWEFWCPNGQRNGTLDFTNFSEETWDLSAQLCDQRLQFSRISRWLYAAAGADEGFLFFNCSAWEVTSIAPDAMPDAACPAPTYPSHARAICDGERIDLPLQQEFYAVTGCGTQFFPQGRSAKGSPFYRSTDGRYLSCGATGWTVGDRPAAGCAETGPLGDATCDFEAQENLQLPLEVYQLWSTQAALASHKARALQQSCSASAAAAPSGAAPDVAYLRVMAGPDSLSRRMLIYSRSLDDLKATAEELGVAFVVSQGWPFAFIFVWLPLAVSLLCSAIPACKCCRCFARERRTKSATKVLLFVLLSVLLGGFGICLGLAGAGLRTLEEGKVMSICGSSQLMETMLDGDGEFVGLKPLLEQIDVVASGRDSEAFQAATEPLAAAAHRATATLQLLRWTLDDLTALLQRLPPLNASSYHRCGYCQELKPQVERAQAELAAYLAASPVATLEALEDASLHRGLHGAAAALGDVQRVAATALPFLFANEALGRLWNEAFGILVGFLVFLALFLVMTFITSFGALVLFAREPRVTGITGEGEYVKRTSSCSCLSWCFFAVLAMLMCGTAGCLVATYSQLAGFCLELHQPNLTRFLHSTGLESSSNVVALAETCLPSHGPAGTSDVLSLLKSTSSASVRDVLLDFTRSEAMHRLPDISELRRYVRLTPVDALLLPSDSAKTNPRFAAMTLDLRTNVGFSSSVACSDHQLNGQQVVPGMETFFASFRSLGVASNSSCDGLALRCSEVISSSGRACEAAQRWLRVKQTLRGAAFPCHLWRDVETGEVCDVKDGLAAWRCTEPLRRSCGLDEFRQHLRDFDQRLARVFGDLEEEMGKVSSSHLPPSLSAAAPGSCASWAPLWQRFLRGTCFVTLPGLRTMTMAFLAASGTALAGVILMYFVWRRAYDNFSRTSDHVFAPKVGAGAVCSAPSVGQRQAAASAGVTLERSEESFGI